jgi:hypothetical protein
MGQPVRVIGRNCAVCGMGSGLRGPVLFSGKFPYESPAHKVCAEGRVQMTTEREKAELQEKKKQKSADNRYQFDPTELGGVQMDDDLPEMDHHGEVDPFLGFPMPISEDEGMSYPRRAPAVTLTHILGDAHIEFASHLPDLSDSTIKEARAKFAGPHRRYFSPLEKKALIDEEGEAENAGDLDLGGTHYERYEPDEIAQMMLMGL